MVRSGYNRSVDQLVLWGCARCGSPEPGTVSERICDPCLRYYLEGCTTGEEHFLGHPDIDGIFVSNLGAVLSRTGMLHQSPGGKGNYPTVTLPGGSRRRVHHLSLETFIGPRPPGKNGLHWDDDPKNNLLMNLRWGTQADNKEDERRNRWPACRMDGCDRPAMGGASGARCVPCYREWRAEVAQRALELTAR